MNNSNFSGRLTKDAEVKNFTNGDKPGKVYKFTVAVDRQMTKAQREKAKADGKPTADYVPITMFVNGEASLNYWAPDGSEKLLKGVFVEISNAKFTTDSYEKDGNKVYTYTFNANDVKIINTSSTTSDGVAAAPAQETAPATAPNEAPAPTPDEIADAVGKMPWD